MDINGNENGPPAAGGPAVPNAQNFLNIQAATEILLQKLLSFATPDKEQALRTKIEALGLSTIADLCFLEDLDKSFSDVLKPVGIGKLKGFLRGMFQVTSFIIVFRASDSLFFYYSIQCIFLFLVSYGATLCEK